MKIVFTGGGTGGHIFPIIALSREIRKIWLKEKLDYNPPTTQQGKTIYNPPTTQKEEKIEFFYLGPKDEFCEILLSQEGIKVKKILAGKIRRYFSFGSFFANFFDILFKTPIGIFQAFFHLFFLAPDLIFSKGGYGSFPVVLAGWLLGTPIFLHESDAEPGMANRLLAKFSLEIFVSFPKTIYFHPEKMILVGNPIRRELLEVSKEEAKNFFKLSGEKPVILILGGSQGAQRINDNILEILPEILKEFELIHQCGENNFKEVRAGAEIMIKKELEKYYHLFPFLREEELKMAYGISDLVVSRAGSGSIFEIAALGKPSVLIPLPEAAQNHQLKNAYSFAEGGAALILEEENFTPHFFLEKLKYLISHPEALEKMAKMAQEFSKPQAAKIIADYIVSYLTVD